MIYVCLSIYHRLTKHPLETASTTHRGILMVTVRHHIRHIGCDLLNVSHELVAHFSPVTIKVVRKIPHVQHHVSSLHLRHEPRGAIGACGGLAVCCTRSAGVTE